MSDPTGTIGKEAERRFRRKKHGLVALLVAFALWPVAHGFWVENYLVNPWRMFGWAMYCVPSYEPQIRFFAGGDGTSGEIQFPRGSATARLRLETYLRQRGQLGDLASPRLLAAEILRAYPSLDTVTIAVSHPVYSPDEAGFRSVRRRYDFSRRGAGAPPATAPPP